MTTPMPSFEAPIWTNPDASEAGGRTFRDDELGGSHWEGWVVWRSANYSPTHLATARLERTDTHKPADDSLELGEPAGVLSLARTWRELLYVGTVREARALAEAAAALAEAMEAAGIGVEPGASS